MSSSKTLQKGSFHIKEDDMTSNENVDIDIAKQNSEITAFQAGNLFYSNVDTVKYRRSGKVSQRL